MPAIKAVMTPFPHAVAADADLATARQLLSLHRIRHLPVVDGEALLGVLSHGELARAEAAVAAGGVSPPVGAICHVPAYAVGLDEPLDNVLLHMARERLGSALVLKHGRVVGIFTVTDACRAFAEFLRRDWPQGGDDAA